jgi:hypothetical protein
MTDLLHSVPLRSGFALYAAFEQNHPEALAIAREMFPPGSECFMCAGPTAEDFRLIAIEDPAHPQVQAMIGAMCGTCFALPMLQRLHRLRKILAAMFPNIRRHDVRLVSASTLRASLR